MSKYTAGIQKLKAQKADLEEKINKLDQDIEEIQTKQDNDYVTFNNHKCCSQVLAAALIILLMLVYAQYSEI